MVPCGLNGDHLVNISEDDYLKLMWDLTFELIKCQAPMQRSSNRVQTLTPLLDAANCKIFAIDPRLRRCSFVRPLLTATSMMSNASGATIAELM